MVKKAKASHCRTKVVAVGFDHRGNMICIQHNKPRIYRAGGGWHAEELVIKNSPTEILKKIVIARVSPNTGELKPISPCIKCQRLAAKYDIRIESVQDNYC